MTCCCSIVRSDELLCICDVWTRRGQWTRHKTASTILITSSIFVVC